MELANNTVCTTHRQPHLAVLYTKSVFKLHEDMVDVSGMCVLLSSLGFKNKESFYFIMVVKPFHVQACPNP